MRDPQVVMPRTYRQVRRQQCIATLRAFVRRWGVYLAIAACVAGIGAPAVAVWSVLPLFWAVDHPPWAVPVLLLYALIGAALLWAARALLWPGEWAETERALPIPRRQRVMSDVETVMLALLPLAALFGAGTAVLLAQEPVWLRPIRDWAVGALLVALAGAAALAVAGLQRLRRMPVELGSSRADPASRHVTRPRDATRRDALWALVWTPLWRGPARRTARTALMGSMALAAMVGAILLWRSEARWGMAGFVLVALVVVSRLQALSRHELGPLFAHSVQLPLSLANLERARAVIALAPALAGLLLLWAATAVVAMRPALWWSFVAVSCLSWFAEVRMPARDDAAHGARWLVSLALGVALGTEAVA